MKSSEQYFNEIHRIGRLCTLASLVVFFGVTFVILGRYNIWPTLNAIIGASSVLLLAFPFGAAEAVSYSPILGSGTYISFITGNVVNLKMPCAMNAMEIVNASTGTEKGDVVATLAISVSSLITMVLLVVGVILMVPLQPILTAPPVAIASRFILPALFGALAVSTLASGGGKISIKNKWVSGLVPFALILLANLFVMPLRGYEGLLLVLAIPTTILAAKIFYSMKIIKIVEKK